MATHRWNGWTRATGPREPMPVIARGRGCHVWDVDGRRYLDGVAGAANTPFGHAHPVLTAAITTQLTRIAHMDETLAALEPADALMPALGALTGMHDIVLTGSGSEAIEAALRITMDYWHARGDTGRDTVIAFTRGYHGCTATAQALSGLPVLHTDWAHAPRVHHVDLTAVHHPDHPGATGALADAFATALDLAGRDRVAAVIVEPFLYVGGGIVLPPGLLTALQHLTTTAGCLLIVDEVFTGFGRCGGTGFATAALPRPPDILTISKGMTGGTIPMGATCLRAGIRDRFGDTVLRYGHTTSGHGLAAAAALATAGLLTDSGLTDAATTANWFTTCFRPAFAAAPGIREARTYGVTGVLDCGTAAHADAIAAAALTRGLIAGREHTAVVLTPALTATTGELDQMAALLHDAVEHTTPDHTRSERPA
ncbi:aminotransferase class III-fold pyridoxal phosphate-dependent enzyme [Nocardia sp. alder85J]|uniref:aminotransferase class III-fold pyridoxal phosphate-dependent enzyme n=1 Tax=Nocardia sp. alder85J TaxID=2862949 RepID=UPI001CD72668|nr:aminotransferase class III-fold pyridoxal phosphate-dependent enzyme [Nocardia sp. alder85J]MCX4097762.1 aminotransferase class III-fold pyridoxal phosphate-dependent enzyme [Nocardia sp. alder85J]